MKRSLWMILVPTTRNDGRPIRTRYHAVWDEKVQEISGGLTILKPAKGKWKSPSGKDFTERMIPVMLTATPEQMEKISQMTAKYYEQEAVMYWLVSETFFIDHFNQDNKLVRREQ